MKSIQYLLGIGCVKFIRWLVILLFEANANIDNNYNAIFVAAEVPVVLAWLASLFRDSSISSWFLSLGERRKSLS